MNGEFTHLRDAQKAISEVKRVAGLTSDELPWPLSSRTRRPLDVAEKLLFL